MATVTKISKSMTEADRAYRILQNSILMGELKPGEKITRRQMAEIAGTSVIPVTEALQRLESSGLVTREPNGRTSVAPVSYTHLDVYKRQEQDGSPLIVDGLNQIENHQDEIGS